MRQALRRSMLFVLALAGLAAPAAAQTGTITGRVTTSENSSAVANAEVHAISAGRTVAQSLTNTDGRYRLAVPAGTYAVHVEMVGYEAVIRPGVQVTAGGSTSLDIAISPAVYQLNPVVVTASKRTEKATEAPAHVEVVSEREIAARPTVTPVDHIRNTPGVDVVTSGVQSTNVVVRGFNNIFSGSLHALTDHRIAGIPSLRVNFLHFIAAGDDDLQRVEVVLGPGSALYGPNTAHGVLHMITKSPLTEQGTTVSVSGGTQDLMQLSFRTAQKFSERVGFKISGNYMQAQEWQYIDPVEQFERRKYDSIPFLRFDLMRTLDNIPATDTVARRREADIRIARIGNRDFDVERWSGEARADWRATDNLTLVLQGGLTNIGKGVELTGLGAGQALDWNSSYVQARGDMGRLFGQVYLNMSDAGNTFLLRNGAPIVDKSKLLVAQLQHGYAPTSWADLTYGIDYLKTTPQTEGSINGIYEDEDETTEVGGYLQVQSALHPMLDLVLAGRLDDHSGLPDPIFSPRAGLLFKPGENQAFRATYNRAFSTPSSLNQYLDLSSAMPSEAAARLGYSIRVQGTGTRGFSFEQPGGYQMRSPFLNSGLTIIPADASQLWPAAVGVVAAQAPAGTLPPNLVQYLSSLRPTSAQIGTMFLNLAVQGATPQPIANLDLQRVDPIRESNTTTWEVGYRGALWNRLMLAGDVWWETLEDFVTPLTIQTPLLTMNGQQIAAYLVPRLMQDLGMSQQQAVGLATALAPGLASVPVGVIAAPEMHATGAQVLTTYYNVEDKIDLNGFDLAATYLLNNNWALGGTYSWVNEDVFKSERGEAITLNAPKNKWTAHTSFRKPEWGFDTELRVRYNDAFPVRSGVYNGTKCIGGTEPGAEDCVESYTLVDLNASYRVPGLRGATIQAYIQNLLDEDYRSYPGVPTIGTMALLRLKYNF